MRSASQSWKVIFVALLVAVAALLAAQPSFRDSLQVWEQPSVEPQLDGLGLQSGDEALLEGEAQAEREEESARAAEEEEQQERARVAAKAEAARLAEEEKARVAAEEAEAARVAAEEAEAARVAVEQAEARVAAEQAEAARLAAEQQKQQEEKRRRQAAAAAISSFRPGAPPHRTLGGCTCLPVTNDHTGTFAASWAGCGEAGWCDVAPNCASARESDGDNYAGWDECVPWDARSML